MRTNRALNTISQLLSSTIAAVGESAGKKQHTDAQDIQSSTGFVVKGWMLRAIKAM